MAIEEDFFIEVGRAHLARALPLLPAPMPSAPLQVLFADVPLRPGSDPSRPLVRSPTPRPTRSGPFARVRTCPRSSPAATPARACANPSYLTYPWQLSTTSSGSVTAPTVAQRQSSSCPARMLTSVFRSPCRSLADAGRCDPYFGSGQSRLRIFADPKPVRLAPSCSRPLSTFCARLPGSRRVLWGGVQRPIRVMYKGGARAGGRSSPASARSLHRGASLMALFHLLARVCVG
jgi:hypothetical protein